MKQIKFLFYVLFLLSFAITSCDKDETTEAVNESEVLAKYLESTDSPLGKDFVNSDMPTFISAEAVHNDVITGADTYIIDIRSASDFANGHIEGAVNVADKEVLNHVKSQGLAMNDKIVVACTSGQTAGWAVCILRLNGYSNSFDMKWGMCSWNTDFAAAWQGKLSNMYSTQFEDGPVAKGAVGNMPELNTGMTTGQSILEDRSDVVMTEGFAAAKISAADVFANPGNYYVINYWDDADYVQYGHIPGAMQYTPKQSIAFDVDLKTLPTDKTIVVYCWTGQTSAFLTSYLRLLGYDAKSLVYGANSMIYDELTGHKWSDNLIMDFDYVK